MSYFLNNHTPGPYAVYEIDTETSHAAAYWIREHPVAMDAMQHETLAPKAGRIVFAVQVLVQHYRWLRQNLDVNAQTEEFKINASYAAYIGRTLVLRDPGLQGLMHFRRVKGEYPTFGLDIEDTISEVDSNL